MKKLTGILYIVILFLSGQENDAIKNDLTGNDTALPPGRTNTKSWLRAMSALQPPKRQMAKGPASLYVKVNDLLR